MNEIELLREREWEHSDFSDGCATCHKWNHHAEDCAYAQLMRKVGGKEEEERQANQVMDEARQQSAPPSAISTNIQAFNVTLREYYTPEIIELFSDLTAGRSRQQNWWLNGAVPGGSGTSQNQGGGTGTSSSGGEKSDRPGTALPFAAKK